MGRWGNGAMSKMQNVSAQRHSKMSNGRLSGLFCRWQGGRLSENSSAQRGSGISNLKAESENSPAKRDYGDNMRGDLPPVVYNIWSAQSTKY